MFRKIICLGPSKECMEDDITTIILHGTGDIVCSSSTKLYDDTENAGKYPSSMKTEDVTSLPKYREKNGKPC